MEYIKKSARKKNSTYFREYPIEKWFLMLVNLKSQMLPIS